MGLLQLRAATISFVLFVLLCTPISGTISATEPPDGGQSITITGEVTWDQDDDFDGIVDEELKKLVENREEKSS